MGNKHRGVVMSYVGVPVPSGVDGELFGTLCHFDAVAHDISPEDFGFFKNAGLLLPAHVEPPR
ncbi:MAG: hypothetical protein QM617_15505 [Comamonas sp.]